MFDVTADVTVTVRLTIDGTETTTSFVASLVCATSGECEKSARDPESLEPAGCDGNGPKFLDNFVGNSETNPQEQQWYVPYKNYILTKLKLFKGRSDNVASGFEVTYSPDNKDITGWPEVTQLFGNEGLNEDAEEIEFSQEIKAIEYCIDVSTPNEYSHDLEGFRFTLYDD